MRAGMGLGVGAWIGGKGEVAGGSTGVRSKVGDAGVAV